MTNSIIFFYLIALVPAIIGSLLFMFDKKINVWEWLGGTAIAFLTSAIMHGIAIYSMTADIECWSGVITHAYHFTSWTEQYQQMHTRTVGSGKNQHTEIYYTTEYSIHPEHWSAYLNFGTIDDEKEISQQKFNEIKGNFGNVIENAGKQSATHGGHCIGGDNTLYRSPNKTGYMYPVTITRHFENRIKAAPTLFSFAKVPTNAPVYEWPKNNNWMASDRLIGESRISLLEFDRMNSRLGPVKKINCILINFGLKGREIAEVQKAKMLGGKKNDIVICYGQVGTNIASWSMVFGWSNSEICKRNLETVLLTHPINNDILPVIEKEIRENYVIKDWKSFDYVQVEPPIWAYWTLIITMIITQSAFYIWANFNEFTKYGFNSFRYQMGRRSW